jgi:hypothetical protein
MKLRVMSSTFGCGTSSRISRRPFEIVRHVTLKTTATMMNVRP